MIHSTAIVDPQAELGANVTVGPFTVIGPDVVIGDNNQIGSHVVIKGPTTIGSGNRIFQFASVGEECQDKKYRGEPTRLEIGDNNVIRESVTLHRGTVQDEGLTKIGSGNLMMACSHVAHDVVIGDNCILANYVGVAGHVKMEDFVICGGQAGIHQFCRLGAHSFVAAGKVLIKDVPPFVMTDGERARGLNLEGLKRRGFSPEAQRAVRQAYKILYRQGLTVAEAMPELEQLAAENDDIKSMVNFLNQTTRGIVR